MFFIKRFLKLIGYTATVLWWEKCLTRHTQYLRTIDSAITTSSIDRPQYDPAGPPSTVTDLAFPITPLLNFPPYKAASLPSSNTGLILVSQNDIFETWFDIGLIENIIFVFATLWLAYQVWNFVTWLVVKFCKFVGLCRGSRQSVEARDFEIHKAAFEAERVAAKVEVAEKDNRLKILEKDCLRKNLVIRANKNIRTRDKGIIQQYEESLQDAMNDFPPLLANFDALHNTKSRLQQENADLKTVETKLRHKIKTQAEARTRDREEVTVRHEEAFNFLRDELKESERKVQLLLDSQTKFQAEAKLLRSSDAKLQTEVAELRSRADEAEEQRDEYKMMADASAASLTLRNKELTKRDMEGAIESKWLREATLNLQEADKRIRDADRKAAAAEADAITSKKDMKASKKALSSLQNDHQTLNTKYQTAAKQLRELESKLSHQKAEVVKYTKAISVYDTEFATQLKKNASLYSFNNDLQKEGIALRKEYDTAVKTNEDLTEKNKQLQVRAQKEKAAFSERTDSYHSSLDKRDKEINEVKKLGNQYYHSSNAAQQSLEKEQKKLLDCQGELAAVKTELATVKTEVDTVNTELDSVKAGHDAATTELDTVKKELAAAKSDVNFQQRAFEELSKKFEIGKSNFKRLQAEYNKNRAIIKTLQTQIKSHEDDQDKTKTSNAANPAASKQLQSQMMNLQHANATMRKEKDFLQFQANCMTIGFSQLRILGIYPVEPLNRNGKGLQFVDFVKVDPRRHDLSRYKTGYQFFMVYRDQRENAIEEFDRSSFLFFAINPEPKNGKSEKKLVRQKREGPPRRRHSITYGEQTNKAADFFRPGDVPSRSGMKYPEHRNQRPREDNNIPRQSRHILAAINRLASYPVGTNRREVASEDDVDLIITKRDEYDEEDLQADDDQLRRNKGHMWAVQDTILNCNSQAFRGKLGHVLLLDNALEESSGIERRTASWGDQMNDIHDMHIDWRARETRIGYMHDDIMVWRKKFVSKIRFDGLLSKVDVQGLTDLMMIRESRRTIRSEVSAVKLQKDSSHYTGSAWAR